MSINKISDDNFSIKFNTKELKLLTEIIAGCCLTEKQVFGSLKNKILEILRE